MRTLAALVLILGITDAQTWQSRLFPNTTGRYQIQSVNFNGRTWTLDDFSYSGYALGTRSLGPATCRTVTITGTGDITTELQSRIDTLAAAGGGTVAIPPGSFTLSSSIAIPYNNISIEGAGSGKTSIDVPASYPSLDGDVDGLFTFGKKLGTSNNGWLNKGTVLTSIPNKVRRGDLFVDVASASSIQAGAWVVVQQFFWPALTTANSTEPNAWPSTGTDVFFSFSYLRQVVSITGNRVFLDAPIPWDLDPANNSVSLRLTDNQMKENAGIKGVTIHFQNNIGLDNRPHGTAVYFEGVRNGWVDDVQVLNFPRNGIYARTSARITILDSVVKGAQDYGGNGYGYGFLVAYSQNVLVKRCHGEDTRHNFITARAATSTVVFSQCQSVNERDPDDTHYSFEQSLLWDRHTQQAGTSFQALNRGCESTGAYETLASGVMWNFNGDGVKGQVGPGGGEIHMKPSPDGWGIQTGTTGSHKTFDNSRWLVDNPVPSCTGGHLIAGAPVTAAPGLQVGSAANGALQNVLYEGLYQPGLAPGSLFETLLANRLGAAPPDWASACNTAPVLNAGGLANAASYATGPVAPGEIVVLFGSGIGPLALAGLQLNDSGLAAGSVAGTRVLFDGYAAPVVYTSDKQVSAVVPYEVAGRVATSLQIEYQGQRSSTISVPTAPVAPGVFTVDASGKGQAAALNQDNSYNTASTPASKGSTIAVYATGEGLTTPASVDGKPASVPLTHPQANVSASIGGVTAAIQYVGGAPGLVAGVLQFNVQVPLSVGSGAVPLVLTIGSVSSQTGVTVSVR